MIPKKAPWVKKLTLDGTNATITCPLCHQTHTHPNVKPGKTEHRAAGCALYAPVNPRDRALGYRFIIPRGKK